MIGKRSAQRGREQARALAAAAKAARLDPRIIGPKTIKLVGSLNSLTIDLSRLGFHPCGWGRWVRRQEATIEPTDVSRPHWAIRVGVKLGRFFVSGFIGTTIGFAGGLLAGWLLFR